MTRVERKPIAFSKWTPVARDSGILYEYVDPTTGRTVKAPSWRWMHAKMRVAQTAIWTGVSEFTVYGGAGSSRWVRTVTVSQEEADRFFLDAIDGGFFTLKTSYRIACGRRRRRVIGAQTGGRA